LLRLSVLILLVAAGAIWLEPSWHEDRRVLTLRVREGDEIVGLLRERALDLGRRVIQAAGERPAPAPVGAGTASATSGKVLTPDKLTPEDRDALNRLIEEKIRENERGKATGAN